MEHLFHDRQLAQRVYRGVDSNLTLGTMKSALALLIIIHVAHSEISLEKENSEQKCVAAKDVNFDEVSSIKVDKSGNAACEKLCHIVYVNSTIFLKFFHDQEEEIKCICFSSEEKAFKGFTDPKYCNIPCPVQTNKTCGGLHESITSSQLDVYYSTFTALPETSTTTPTTTSIERPTPPITESKWKDIMGEHILDTNNKIIVVIILQIIILFITTLALIWYNICHSDSKLRGEIIPNFFINKVGPESNEKDAPRNYGSTGDKPEGRVIHSGNSTFYE